MCEQLSKGIVYPLSVEAHNILDTFYKTFANDREQFVSSSDKNKRSLQLFVCFEQELQTNKQTWRQTETIPGQEYLG